MRVSRTEKTALVDGQPDVTGGDQVHSGAYAVAVNGRDHRLGAAGDGGHRVLHHLDLGPGLTSPGHPAVAAEAGHEGGAELLEVEADGEVVAAGGDDDRPHRRIIPE